MSNLEPPLSIPGKILITPKQINFMSDIIPQNSFKNDKESNA